MPAQIDPNIALGVQQQPSLLSQYAQTMALKNAGIRSQLEGLQLKQAGQDYQDTQAERQAIQQNTSTDANGMPTLNRAGAVGQLYQSAPTRGLQLQQQFTQQDITNQKAIADYKKTQLENAKNHVDTVGQLLQGVSDQGTYDKAVQAAQQAGIVQPGELPQVYDPQLVQQKLAQTMTQKDQIAQLQKQQEMAETARHNQASEKNIQATSPQQGKATQLYADKAAGKPLSPADAAWLKGYEKNVDVTKVQPGVVRAEIYANSIPVQVADPNNPGNVVYTSRKNAMGKQAPSSADVQAAKKTEISATSGEIGKNLNAFNTASAHLDTLSKAADALNNGDVNALNTIGNAFQKQTGNPAPTNFQAVKSAVAGEVSKTFKGGQATDAEIKEFNDAVSSANSPAQLKGVIATYQGLMNSKREALQQQVQMGMQGKANFGQQAAPSVIRAVDSQGNLHQAPAGTPLPAGWKLQ